MKEDTAALVMCAVLTLMIALLCSFSTDTHVEILMAPTVVIPGLFAWALDKILAERWPSPGA